MPRRKIVQAVVLFLVVYFAVHGLLTLRRGFSARDNPSWIETIASDGSKRCIPFADGTGRCRLEAIAAQRLLPACVE